MRRQALSKTEKHAAPTERGLTLLEVIISLAILLFSAAAIGQLVMAGIRASTWARRTSEACVRAESVLSQLCASPANLQSTGPVKFDDDPAWEYEVEAIPAVVPSLVRVTVTVRHYNVGSDKPDAEVSLARLVATPAPQTDQQSTSSLIPTQTDLLLQQPAY